MCEHARIAFLEQRDGKVATVQWVRRTLKLYRQALLIPKHTFVRPIRLSLHESYHAFKQYLKQNPLDNVSHLH